jgi:hypothetical protein
VEPTVVLDAEAAVFASRIFPGDHEHGVALLDKIADERVLRRQVEDIVLHNPGRHDQDGLGAHLRRCRSVLTEFDQAIAKDDLPGVTARLSPTSNASAPTGFAPTASRCQSSHKFSAPRMNFMAFCLRVCAMTSGLVNGKFFGETVSSAWRARNATISS